MKVKSIVTKVRLHVDGNESENEMHFELTPFTTIIKDPDDEKRSLVVLNGQIFSIDIPFSDLLTYKSNLKE